MAFTAHPLYTQRDYVNGADSISQRKRPYDTITTPNILQGNGSLKRVLTWYDLTCQGIGVIIGTGIFTLPGIVYATMTGASLPLAFLISFVCMLLVAIMYAEFAAMSPKAGGAYTYTA